MATPRQITLRCVCGTVMPYDRDLDPDLPEEVAMILATNCPECDGGDFGTETWFDAEGFEIPQGP